MSKQKSKKPKRLGRILFRGAGVVIVLVGCFIAFFPSWLSSSYGKEYLTHQVFGHWHGEVSAQRFDIGWNDPLTIHDVQAKFDGQTILEIDRIQTELTFPKLVSRNGGFELIKVFGSHLVLEQGEGKTRIEKMIPIDPDGNSRIEIEQASIELTDEEGFHLAQIEGADLTLEIKRKDDRPHFEILPTQLLQRQKMKLELRQHLPAVMKVFFKTRYTDAIVSTRLLHYSEWLDEENSVRSKTELVIHRLMFDDPKTEQAVTPLIKQFSGIAEDSPDIAIVHLTTDKAIEGFELVPTSQFGGVEASNDQR